MMRTRKKLTYFLAAFLFILGCVLMMLKITSREIEDEETLQKYKLTKDGEDWKQFLDPVAYAQTHNLTFDKDRIRIADDNDSDDILSFDQQTPNYNVHIFYYAWYGNPSIDKKYLHWNHKFLPHWRPEIAKKYIKGEHVPPDDIGSNFYPALGPYSSRNTTVIHNHMKQLCAAGVGVLVLSWYPQGIADDQGNPPDSLVTTLLDIALMYDIRVTLHIEPYKGRNDKTLHEDVKYIIKKYGQHKGFYRYKHQDGRELPLLYVYDSYQTPASDWAQLLKADGSHTIRNTDYDCIFIALVVESKHKEAILVGGFDGLYTYFAINGFSYGSSWRIWPQLAAFAKQTNTLFIPSVGPGYVDTSIRPWNSENTRLRNEGEYYKKSWNNAVNVKPEIISITSFNEWHEGTQIEEAWPKLELGLVYKDYYPHNSDYYLKLTNHFVNKFKKSKEENVKKTEVG